MNTNTEAFFRRFFSRFVGFKVHKKTRGVFLVEAIFYLGSKARVSEIKLSGSETSDSNPAKQKKDLPKNIPKNN